MTVYNATGSYTSFATQTENFTLGKLTAYLTGSSNIMYVHEYAPNPERVILT